MAALSPEAIAMLEFALGPKAKRGKPDPNANRAGKALGKFAIASATAPIATGFKNFTGSTHEKRSAQAIAALKRTVNKTPEVMVKLTGRQKGAGHVAANFVYISRLGHPSDDEVTLETHDGKTPSGYQELKDLADKWQAWEMADEVRRKGATSLSIVLSMPNGTDPQKTLDAARAFAQDEMANRRWVMALHNDTDQPHVHLTVARRDLDGTRFHPNKDDLYRYRQKFAEQLRARGIDANATPRKARGISQKAEPTAVHKMRQRGKKPMVDEWHKKDAIASVQQAEEKPNPFDRLLKNQRAVVRGAYEQASKELAQSDDPEMRTLGERIAEFFRDMKPAQSRATKDSDRLKTAITKSAEKKTPPDKAAPSNSPGKDR